MNEIANKFLSARDKFVFRMNLRQHGFNSSAWGPFPKNKERMNMFKNTTHSSYIYQNDLDKACFQHDKAYEDFKDLKRIIIRTWL